MSASRASNPVVSAESGIELTHVFVVRFWCEPRELAHAARVWRGVIEHVQSGERRSLQRPDDVAHVIDSYLDSHESKRGLVARIGDWLRAKSIRSVSFALCTAMRLAVSAW